MTDLLEGQLGWKQERDHLAASRKDPLAFAAAWVRLHEDSELWQKIRREALSRVEESCSFVQMEQVLCDSVLVGEGSDA
jgi:hypothetical protein